MAGEMRLCSAGGVAAEDVLHALEPRPPGQGFSWVGEETRGLAQRKGSALIRKTIWSFLMNSPSDNIFGFNCLSFLDRIPGGFISRFPCLIS